LDNLKDIEFEIKRLAKTINAPEIYLPTFGVSEDSGRPCIEFNGHEYSWVLRERGEEYKRISTAKKKEILFLTFESVTFEMAVRLELEKRKEGEDVRIQLFRIQEELISVIDKDFEYRIREKHDKLLNKK